MLKPYTLHTVWQLAERHNCRLFIRLEQPKHHFSKYLHTFVLMDVLIYFPNVLVQKVWNSPFCFKGLYVIISNYDAFMSLKSFFILGNSVDPDEMLPYAAFHMGLPCLPKYMFTCIQNEKNKH